MSWERDPLWAKSKLFFQHAFGEPRDDPAFGLWCSLGLELLGRAALASISPTLLAEPDTEHKYLLHALDRGSERIARKSIAAIHVFSLCKTIFPDFTDEDCKASIALMNRRNEELHSGTAAFVEYQSSLWLEGFYRACRSLCSALGESLESLFGKDEADVAARILEESQNDVRQRVESSIAAHRKVFRARQEEEQKVAATRALEQGTQLATQGHHHVTCPACGCIATVQGTPFGKERKTDEDGEIVVRQSVAPTSFSCSACGLKLHGYAELAAAKTADHYTRRTTYSPAEFYGLFDQEYLDQYLAEHLGDRGEEYDNE